MLDLDAQAEGNKEVVKSLKKWNEEALRGKLNAIAIVASSGTGRMGMEYSGVVGKEADIYLGMERLKMSLMDSLLRRQMPPPNTQPGEKLDASYAVFNRGVSPHCFDFINWVINSEMIRIKEGAPAPLKVCFYGQPPAANEYLDEMFYNVMVPSLKLVGAVQEPRASDGWCHNDLAVARPAVEMFNAGQPIVRFKATPPAVSMVTNDYTPKTYVALTLREAKHWPHRNSHLPEWLKFADYLKAKGYRPIFVRDTAKADEAIEGYETYPMAAKDIDVRMAFSEGALCNVGVSNGPSSMWWYGTSPFICLVTIEEDSNYKPNTTNWWWTNNGIKPGEQFPWLLDKQRLVWCESDSYEQLVKSWEEIYEGV